MLLAVAQRRICKLKKLKHVFFAYVLTKRVFLPNDRNKRECGNILRFKYRKKYNIMFFVVKI